MPVSTRKRSTTRPNSNHKNAARRKPFSGLRLESLEVRRLMTADAIDFHPLIEQDVAVVVQDLATMVQIEADPQLIFDVQQLPDADVFDASEQMHQVDPTQWLHVLEESSLPDLGPLFLDVPEVHNALTDLVLLEFVDVSDEALLVDQLVDLIADELVPPTADSLPPQLEQLRMELGDESFAEWLHSNVQQTGNCQGVSEDAINEDIREEFEAVEGQLKKWLADFEAIDVMISGKQSSVWTVEPFELSVPGSTARALPWINLNTLEVEYGSGQLLTGNELTLFGSNDVTLPELIIPTVFVAQHGCVGTWSFPNLADGHYRVEVDGIAPISFSVLKGSGSPSAASANKVDFLDFSKVAGNFGSTTQTASGADLNGDGVVNFLDFSAVAGNFGHLLPPLDLAPEDWSVETDLCGDCVVWFSPNPDPNPPGGPLADPVNNAPNPLANVPGIKIPTQVLRSEGELKADGEIEVTKQSSIGLVGNFRVTKTVTEAEEGPVGCKVKVTKTKIIVKDKRAAVGKFTTITIKEYHGDKKNSKGEVTVQKGTKMYHVNDPTKPTITSNRINPDGSGTKTETPRKGQQGEGATRTTYGPNRRPTKSEVFTNGAWK